MMSPQRPVHTSDDYLKTTAHCQNETALNNEYDMSSATHSHLLYYFNSLPYLSFIVDYSTIQVQVICGQSANSWII